MVADTKGMPKGRPSKRDSVLRMNLAVALHPYRFNATFHQSPLNAGASPWKNSGSSALLHREVAHTAYQYPFALNLGDCTANKHGGAWTRSLLESIGELSNVAGGHARSLFEIAERRRAADAESRRRLWFPMASLPMGPSPSLSTHVQGRPPGGGVLGSVASSCGDLDGPRAAFTAKGVTLDDNPQRLLKRLADASLPGEG